jgi:hypothetical protein
MLVADLARAYEGEYVSAPPSAGSTHDHLSNPWSSFALMHWVFSDTPRVTAGELPEIPTPPKGSVI